MNWKINLSAILGLALLAKCASPESESRTPPEFPEVTTMVKAADLKHLERLEGGIAIVDMRPPEAYKAGHIKGAVSIWRTDIER
ncbi:MAG TPA: rhodanese-like domain-containing protein, partial [Cryomorphaceae bacterium]|nr:rhodanese-like domain-containing protein [Cryomorphaceae bacterium]